MAYEITESAYSIMKKIYIGHGRQQYPEIRNIIGLVPDTNYRLCRDRFSFQTRLEQLLHLDRPKTTTWFDRQFQFNDFGLNRVDCIHLFNAVNYSSTPWVLTFETMAPRFRKALNKWDSDPSIVAVDKKIKRALNSMSRPTCLALLPISRSAAQIQSSFLSLFPMYESSLLAKTQVLHPPQKLLVADSKRISYPCENSATINFMMIGHHFFRKGGREVLDVLSEVRSESGKDIRLCLVSRIADDSYATVIEDSEFKKVHNFISNNSEWIAHYPVLKPAEVLEKIQASDVGLLPSYAETYGYSVLEFQAAGRPVITTNVRAFPEINNDQCGWLLPVRKREVGGEAFFKTFAERTELSCAIRTGLLAAVKEIVEQPDLIRMKGVRAWERIRDKHDPVAAGEFLKKIYLQARN